MGTDFYRDDFSNLSDADVFQAIETFTRIKEPIVVRPREGFVLDFKQEWNDKALQTVAGFAHTFGGLLIVGVSEKDGQPNELIGEDSAGELKTRIAASIATNISPTPSYEIVDCNHPDKPGKRLAVVRVRQGQQLYYYTKKGASPIYVRKEDQSLPADAGQLRSLIERKTSTLEINSAVTKRMNKVLNELELSVIQYMPVKKIASSVRVVFSPLDHPWLTLDSVAEQQFRKLIRNFSFVHYGNGDVQKTEGREIDWYECRWFRPEPRYESVWRVTSSGDIGYATQANVSLPQDLSTSWSLGDAIVDLLLLLGVARSFWKQSSYYGEARVVVSLSPQRLSIHAPLVSDVWSARSPEASYGIHDFNEALRNSIISSEPHYSESATAESTFNCGLPIGTSGQIIASVMNQVLRRLKYSADLTKLTHAVECFLRVAK